VREAASLTAAYLQRRAVQLQFLVVSSRFADNKIILALGSLHTGAVDSKIQQFGVCSLLHVIGLRGCIQPLSL
jgi:hypothetical protein